jgi:hypothetical protein
MEVERMFALIMSCAALAAAVIAFVMTLENR